MTRPHPARRFVVAAIVAALVAAPVYFSKVAAAAVLCPIHTALVRPPAVDAPAPMDDAHAHHAPAPAPDTTPQSHDPAGSDPFAFACCAAHGVALLSLPLPAERSAGSVPAVASIAALVAAPPSGADPPPRIRL